MLSQYKWQFQNDHPGQNSMHSFISQLISSKHTTITKNASCHVQLNIRTDVMSLKCSPLEIHNVVPSLDHDHNSDPADHIHQPGRRSGNQEDD